MLVRVGLAHPNKADAPGICKPKPTRCTEQFKPICGYNGKIYENARDAASARVSSLTKVNAVREIHKHAMGCR
ncbi:hypothetical protein [Nitrosospira briensis]|uniref:hypothetical protein n=1 Tax=Nitrosospira briensis TaxID=35799 RepID=UPI000944AA08